MSEVIHDSVERLHEVFERSDLQVERRKIEEKLDEAQYNRGAVRPIADCVFSLLLAARNRGYTVDMVFKELEKVAQDNLDRRWKKMPDGTYHAT